MTDDADASLNFRHDEKTSPRSERDGLESLRGEGEGEVSSSSSPRQSLSRGPQSLKPKKKQKRGFPIKDFGNDVGGGGFPPKFQA